MGYGPRFAATGDPNGGAGVVWPRYERESERYLRLDAVPEVGTSLRSAQCDFWDERQEK